MQGESYYELPNIKSVETSTRILHAFPTGFRVCVTGGREITDLGYVWSVLDTLHSLPADLGGQGPIVELGAGCARGVDRLALNWAIANNVDWRCYVADWDRYSEAAGAMRNEAMLLDFKADLLAVYDGGVGTTDCARKCRKLAAKNKLNTQREFFPRVVDPLDDILKWG